MLSTKAGNVLGWSWYLLYHRNVTMSKADMVVASRSGFRQQSRETSAPRFLISAGSIQFW